MLVTVLTVMLAQAPCDPEWPTLALKLGGPGLLPSIAAAVRDESLFEARQVGFCPIDDVKAAKATAIVDWPETGTLSLTVSVPSGQSVRQLQRSLDLSAVPPDGYALTIGSSLGELLREARRELPGLAPSEPEVAPSWGLGAQLAGEAFTGGQLHGGVDVFARHRFGNRLHLQLEAGFRSAVPSEAPSGRVSALAIIAAVHGVFDLLQLGRFAIGAVAGARFGWIRLEGSPRAPSTGAAATGWLSTIRAGAELRWATRPVIFFARLTAGAPVAGVAAIDGDRRVTGTTGFEGGLTVGAGGAW